MSGYKSLGKIAYERKRRGKNLIHYNYQKNGRCKITIPMPIAKQANIEPGIKAIILWDLETNQFHIKPVTDPEDLKYAYTAQNRKAEGMWRMYFTFKHYASLRMPKANYRVVNYEIKSGLCFMLNPSDIRRNENE